MKNGTMKKRECPRTGELLKKSGSNLAEKIKNFIILIEFRWLEVEEIEVDTCRPQYEESSF